MSNFGQISIQIINHNILHTPSNVGVMARKTFPIHQMKPCLLDWQKLVILKKIYPVEEKTSYFIENQTG